MVQTIKLKGKKSENLMEKAYEVIKANICNNSIEPGSLLSETQLANELGMSRTPVREALKILEIDGLVEIRLGIGAFVKTMTYKDVMDLYQVRKALEVMAVDTAVDNITDKEIDELEHDFKSLLSRFENNEHIEKSEFIEIDMALHEILIKKCDNAYVKIFMLRIMENVKRMQMISYEGLNDLEESTQQHLELLAMLRKRNKADIAEAIKKHLKWSEGCIKLF